MKTSQNKVRCVDFANSRWLRIQTAFHSSFTSECSFTRFNYKILPNFGLPGSFNFSFLFLFNYSDMCHEHWIRFVLVT